EGEQQRRERRLERDRRRRERGEPTYFETEAAIEAWPVTGDPADVSTAIIPREQLESFREAEPESERAQRGLARSGVIFAVATGISRIGVRVREIAQAAVVGISGPV